MTGCLPNEGATPVILDAALDTLGAAELAPPPPAPTAGASADNLFPTAPPAEPGVMVLSVPVLEFALASALPSEFARFRKTSLIRSSLAQSIGNLPLLSLARTSAPRDKTSLIRARSLRLAASCKTVVPVTGSRIAKSQQPARGFATKWYNRSAAMLERCPAAAETPACGEVEEEEL